MKEEWRDVKGYEGLYKVSSFGKVLSVATNKIKKEDVCRNGYIRVSLWKNNQQKHVLLHRVVLGSFTKEHNKKEYVDHIDGNKTNNNLNNLRWCSMQENAMNPITRHRKSISKTGHVVSEETRKKIGTKNKQASKKVKCVETDTIYINIAEAERKTKASRGQITRSLQDQNKTANGCHWRYADE